MCNTKSFAAPLQGYFVPSFVGSCLKDLASTPVPPSSHAESPTSMFLTSSRRIYDAIVMLQRPLKCRGQKLVTQPIKSNSCLVCLSLYLPSSRSDSSVYSSEPCEKLHWMLHSRDLHFTQDIYVALNFWITKVNALKEGWKSNSFALVAFQCHSTWQQTLYLRSRYVIRTAHFYAWWWQKQVDITGITGKKERKTLCFHLLQDWSSWKYHRVLSGLTQNNYIWGENCHMSYARLVKTMIGSTWKLAFGTQKYTKQPHTIV